MFQRFGMMKEQTTEYGNQNILQDKMRNIKSQGDLIKLDVPSQESTKRTRDQQDGISQLMTSPTLQQPEPPTNTNFQDQQHSVSQYLTFQNNTPMNNHIINKQANISSNSLSASNSSLFRINSQQNLSEKHKNNKNFIKSQGLLALIDHQSRLHPQDFQSQLKLSAQLEQTMIRQHELQSIPRNVQNKSENTLDNNKVFVMHNRLQQRVNFMLEQSGKIQEKRKVVNLAKRSTMMGAYKRNNQSYQIDQEQPPESPMLPLRQIHQSEQLLINDGGTDEEGEISYQQLQQNSVLNKESKNQHQYYDDGGNRFSNHLKQTGEQQKLDQFDKYQWGGVWNAGRQIKQCKGQFIGLPQLLKIKMEVNLYRLRTQIQMAVSPIILIKSIPRYKTLLDAQILLRDVQKEIQQWKHRKHVRRAIQQIDSADIVSGPFNGLGGTQNSRNKFGLRNQGGDTTQSLENHQQQQYFQKQKLEKRKLKIEALGDEEEKLFIRQLKTNQSQKTEMENNHKIQQLSKQQNQTYQTQDHPNPFQPNHQLQHSQLDLEIEPHQFQKDQNQNAQSQTSFLNDTPNFTNSHNQMLNYQQQQQFEIQSNQNSNLQSQFVQQQQQSQQSLQMNSQQNQTLSSRYLKPDTFGSQQNSNSMQNQFSVQADNSKKFAIDSDLNINPVYQSNSKISLQSQATQQIKNENGQSDQQKNIPYFVLPLYDYLDHDLAIFFKETLQDLKQIADRAIASSIFINEEKDMPLFQRFSEKWLNDYVMPMFQMFVTKFKEGQLSGEKMVIPRYVEMQRQQINKDQRIRAAPEDLIGSKSKAQKQNQEQKAMSIDQEIEQVAIEVSYLEFKKTMIQSIKNVSKQYEQQYLTNQQNQPSQQQQNNTNFQDLQLLEKKLVDEFNKAFDKVKAKQANKSSSQNQQKSASFTPSDQNINNSGSLIARELEKQEKLKKIVPQPVKINDGNASGGVSSQSDKMGVMLRKIQNIQLD
eukprot:403361807